MYDATATPPAALGRSPLIDDVLPRTNRFLEFLMFLGAAVVGFLAAAVVVMTVGFAATIVLVFTLGGEVSAVGDTVVGLTNGEISVTLPIAITTVITLAVLNGLAFFAMVAVASLIRRRPIWRNITAARRFRWRQLAMGLVLYGAALSALVAIEIATGGVEPEWPLFTLTSSAAEIAILLVVSLVGFSIAAFAEEVLFRGWLLRETAVYTRNVVVLLLVNGVLFSLIHFNPESMSLDLNAFVARTIMGVAFGYMALRFGGIEFATGAHAANNILISLVLEPISLAQPAPEALQGGLMIESFILLVIALAVTEATVRVGPLRRLAGIDREAVPEAANPFN